MAKQNKVAKLLKTLAVSSMCIGMLFPVGTINASSQNVESNEIHSDFDVTQKQTVQQKKELEQQRQNLLKQVNDKINSHGGLLKITPNQLKNDVNNVVWFNQDLASEIYKVNMSTKNFDKAIKSKGGYKNVTLVQIREQLAKSYSNNANLQNQLFYAIRNQMMSSKMLDFIFNLPDIATPIINGMGQLYSHNQNMQVRRWVRGNGGLWTYCNGYHANCAHGFWRLPSSHHYVNGHRDNGERVYYFHEGNKALRYTSGWWTYQNHTYYNDSVYGMYTDETYTIGAHRYHFDSQARSKRLW